MSDTRWRDLERRWRATGALEDEAAFLLERVRVGALSEDALLLAAKLGSPAARAAFGLPLHPKRMQIDILTRALEAHAPDEAYARVAVAACMALLEIWSRPTTTGFRIPERVFYPVVRDRIRTAIKMILCPCEQHRAAAGAFARDPRYRPEPFERHGPVTGRVASAIEATGWLLQLAVDPHEPFFEPARVMPSIIGYNLRGLHNNCSEALQRAPFAQMAAAAIDWVLGHDPLPALLARLEAEAANATPIRPPG